MPIADASFEATHRVPLLSSARTPNVERVSCSPGLKNGVGADPSSAIRRTPPSVMLLTNRTPSDVAATLSGNGAVSGSVTSGMPAAQTEPTTNDAATDNAVVTTHRWILRFMRHPFLALCSNDITLTTVSRPRKGDNRGSESSSAIYVERPCGQERSATNPPPRTVQSYVRPLGAVIDRWPRWSPRGERQIIPARSEAHRLWRPVSLRGDVPWGLIAAVAHLVPARQRSAGQLCLVSSVRRPLCSMRRDQDSDNGYPS